MKLKVLLLLIPVMLVLFYIIISTAIKAFEICKDTEYFAVNEDQKGKSINQILEKAEKEGKLQEARQLQDMKITEVGGKQNLDDPVGDAYLPYSYNVYDKDLPSADDIQAYNNFEYIITAAYKQVLDRNPSEEELLKTIALFKSGEMNEELLRTYLYNSTEYAMISRVQSNEIRNDLEYASAKQDIMAIISRLYFAELEVEVPKKMLLPLRDMLMYFNNDQYMFRGFLLNDNYKKFETEVIGTRRLKKENILDVYRKYINEDDVKYTANDMRRYDLLTKSNQSKANPQSLPTNTAFQGTDLTVVAAGIGAGSGAQSTGENKALTIDELLKQ
jgi:hypothetical protein